MLHFVETPVFTRRPRGVLDDDAYRHLQLALVLRPTAGALVADTGGIRKIRSSAPGRGRCGGVRIIYYWASTHATIYMLYVYARNEQDDLTPAQRRALARAVREELE